MSRKAENKTDCKVFLTCLRIIRKKSISVSTVPVKMSHDFVVRWPLWNYIVRNAMRQCFAEVHKHILIRADHSFARIENPRLIYKDQKCFPKVKSPI